MVVSAGFGSREEMAMIDGVSQCVSSIPPLIIYRNFERERERKEGVSLGV